MRRARICGSYFRSRHLRLPNWMNIDSWDLRKYILVSLSSGKDLRTSLNANACEYRIWISLASLRNPANKDSTLRIMIILVNKCISCNNPVTLQQNFRNSDWKLHTWPFTNLVKAFLSQKFRKNNEIFNISRLDLAFICKRMDIAKWIFCGRANSKREYISLNS